MPLPADNTPWPPQQWAPVFNDMRLWAAWWEGDTQKLWDAYHASPNVYTPGTVRTGLRDFVKRMFWGRETSGTHNRPSRGDLHVPIATDLCATSADTLYSQPPTITSDSAATQDQINQYIDDGLYEQFITGAETGAALGGRYHRVTWDTRLQDRPFITTVDADSALPEFTWGRLTAVTFWTVIERDGGTLYRHLERHELTPTGMGITIHALYEGTGDNLGKRIPLASLEATRSLGLTLASDGTVPGPATPGLNVVYVPNATPQRKWRKHTTACHLGRSDLDGCESLMDALDETYSSWMRDIRLGKARVFADRSMLETPYPTGIRAAAFDLDQEVFTPLENMTGSMADQLPIVPQQFAIRVAEHQQTVSDLVRRIVRTARYSTATFGEDVDDTDITATEVKARQRATATTRDRKIRLEKPAVRALVEKMLTVDHAVFHQPGIQAGTVQVDFPSFLEQDTSQLAQTAATLKQAGIASLQTAIQLVHPDWDTDRVDQEAEAIHSEQPLSSPDTWRMPTDTVDE